ncbi:MAG TPA: hypothetical protein PLC35_01815, partial [Methanosarcina vacuolata]|nr:hypothetical protein [Methanosarcina vacuolata]
RFVLSIGLSSGKCVLLRSEFRSTAGPQCRGISEYLTQFMMNPLIYIVNLSGIMRIFRCFLRVPTVLNLTQI